MKFRVGRYKYIGDEYPVFVIAEVGNNHQGKIELAKRSIKSAYAAGADAVSFQYAPMETYCTQEMYDHPAVAFLQDCEFSLDELGELARYVKEHEMAFSINVEDSSTLLKVIDIGIDFIKLCSADLTNVPFIKFCCNQKLPIFFSTGGSYLDEIEIAYNAMNAAGLQDYVVYHTNSGYPTAVEDANLLQMDLLHEVFGGVKGYCDHTINIIPPIVAVARGAKVIEKHITTNRSLKGDDWMVSLEPDEFARMVRFIRDAEKSLGVKEKKPLPIEKNTRLFKRKSITSSVFIPKGKKFAEEDFCYKIPGTGMSPVKLPEIIGKRAAVDIEADMLVTEAMLD